MICARLEEMAYPVTPNCYPISVYSFAALFKVSILSLEFHYSQDMGLCIYSALECYGELPSWLAGCPAPSGLYLHITSPSVLQRSVSDLY
jgi:hypothetical protein